MTPNRVTASAAYSEQDGRYRHDPVNIGEISILYKRSAASAARCPIESSADGIGWHGQSGGAPLERSAKVGFKAGIGGIEQLTTRNDDDVDARPDRQGLRLPENLSYQPFGAISPHRIPKLPGGDDPQSRRSGLVGRHQHRQVAALGAKRQVKNTFEFAVAPDSAGLREALGRHGAVLRGA